MIAATSSAGTSLSNRTSSIQSRARPARTGRARCPAAAARSPRGTWPSKRSGRPSHRCDRGTRRGKPRCTAARWKRASLIAASTASVPELPRYEQAARDRGDRSSSPQAGHRSAGRSRTRRNGSAREACSSIAATTGDGSSRSSDRDAGSEIEEEVAVDVLDGEALPTDGTIGYARGRLGDVRSRRTQRGDVPSVREAGEDVGTGRSPAIRDEPDDKVHLCAECITSMQVGYPRGV